MGSKQINFYLFPSDLTKVDLLFEELGNVRILGLPMLTQKLRIAKKVGSADFNQKNWVSTYLVMDSQLDQVILEFVEKQNYWLIDDLRSPIIELIRPYFDVEKNLLRRGRLYFKNGYWNENREWVRKNDAFLDWANLLFKRFRKVFQRSQLEGFRSDLISPDVENWVLKENGRLVY